MSPRAPERIEYLPSAALPKLAWLAALDTERGRLIVRHGEAVECAPQWMVEGVWDGAFEQGEFHRGAHLFGSGIRLDGDRVLFVPSAALVDRLYWCRDGTELLVANSLVALLAATGALLDPRHDYVREAKAMFAGVDAHDPAFRVLHPSVERFEQLYHKALVVRNGSLSQQRTIAIRTFASFAEYVGALRQRLSAVCANAADPARRTPLERLGTLSSGYDSTAVTALVKDLGVGRFFTYVGSNGPRTRGLPEYQTAPIAAALGIATIGLEEPRPPPPEDDLLLRAGSPLGNQLPLAAMAKHIEQSGRVAAVFTGYHGDIVWDANVPDSFVAPGIVRLDASGLDLSELRLKSGFFNVAVPFLFAASIASIVAISRSREMDPWRLGTAYDRPVSRRLVEGAGVARHLFGVRKGGLLGGGARPKNPELRQRYFRYLSRTLLPLPLFFARIALDRFTIRALVHASRFAKYRLRSPRLDAVVMRQLHRFGEGYSWYGRHNYRGALYTWSVMELARRLRDRGFSHAAVASADLPAPTPTPPPTPAPEPAASQANG